MQVLDIDLEKKKHLFHYNYAIHDEFATKKYYEYSICEYNNRKNFNSSSQNRLESLRLVIIK